MKILFVVPRFHTNQYQMVKTLQEKEHEVYFHVASKGFTEDYTLLTPEQYKQCKASVWIESLFGKGGVNRPNYFPNPLSYYQLIKQLKPAIVIIRDPYKIFSFIAAVCALFIKAKIVFYTQEDIFRSRSKKTKLKQRITLAVFKAAWMTPILGNEKNAGNKVKHMYYVPLPIPVKPINNYKKDYSGELKILMVGKYHQERKNHLLFIDAINQLKQKYNFKVTIVGECKREQQLKKFGIVQETVNRLGLSDIVELKKNVPFTNMENLYTSHHIFVLPAKDEPYSISVVEALGYGLPSICTDTCGARFNIHNGENGYVVKSNSLEELTAAMENLIANKDKVKVIASGSMFYVQQNLSGDAFYKKFSSLVYDRFKIHLSP